MKIYEEISLEDFKAWSGGKDTLQELTSEECETIERMWEELYPEGSLDTELNDFLWFERDTIAEWLGYNNWEHLERAHNGDDEDEEEDY